MSVPTPGPSTLRETLEIARAARIFSPCFWGWTAGYFILTVAGTLVEGAAWLFLVKVFTSGSALADAGGRLSPDHLLRSWGLNDSLPTILRVTALLFFLRAVGTILLCGLESLLQAEVRRRVQERGLESLLFGEWEALRDGHVGRWVGSLTEESSAFAKLFMSIYRAFYALASFAILGALALAVAPGLSLLMALVGLPAWGALKFLYSRQSTLSNEQVRSRQHFAADVTERLTGLFQIKAADETAPYLKSGLRRQDELTRAEVAIGWMGGVITSFQAILMAGFLLAYELKGRWGGAAFEAGALGSVGVLGFRAMNHLNYLVAALGNLTRLSGSIAAVLAMLRVRREPAKKSLPAPLREVRLEGVSYAFNGRTVLSRADLAISSGTTFLITGPSGAGKTTLANLIAGIIEPSEGRVVYVDPEGRSHDGRDHRPRFGYVTQDVHLFRGTVRENLDPLSRLADAELWRCLRESDAEAFVQSLGGLDGDVAEAGRAFSGGEKRRLAIARALAQRTDGLILDEVTNGLDAKNRGELLETISRLGRQMLVIAIAHDLPTYDAVPKTVFELASLTRAKTQEST